MNQMISPMITPRAARRTTYPPPRPHGLLVNAAIMPTLGLTYRPELVNQFEFIREVQRFHALGTLFSFIGYPQTAEFLSQLCNVPVPVSRQPCVVRADDTLLICRLRYRVENPSTKGAPVSDSDFEFIVCTVEE